MTTPDGSHPLRQVSIAEPMPLWAERHFTPKQLKLSARTRWALILDLAPLSSCAHHVGLRLHLFTAGDDYDEKVAWPSIAKLASCTKWSATKIRSALHDELKALGLLLIEAKDHGKGHASNLYRLSWPTYDIVTTPVGEPASLLCGERNRHGRPCGRRAGWGVAGSDGGPCRHHLDTALIPHDARYPATPHEVPGTSRDASGTSPREVEYGESAEARVRKEYGGAIDHEGSLRFIEDARADGLDERTIAHVLHRRRAEGVAS